MSCCSSALNIRTQRMDKCMTAGQGYLNHDRRWTSRHNVTAPHIALHNG